MPEIVQEIGAAAGLAAVVGLAVLSALYFSQARDVKRLREWAGRAPERAETGAPLVPGRVVATPQPAKPATPSAPAAPTGPPAVPGRPTMPAAAAAAGAGPATATQSPPAAAGAGGPATAAGNAAHAAGSKPATPGAPAKPEGEDAKSGDGAPAKAADGEKPADGAAKPADGTAKPADAPDAAASPGAAPQGSASPQGSAAPQGSAGPQGSAAPSAPAPASPAASPSAPPVPTPAGAGSAPSTPAGRAPVSRPPTPSPRAPLRPSGPSRPSPQSTQILRPPSEPWYRRLGTRYVALVLVGLVVLGGAAAYGVSQLTGGDSGDGANEASLNGNDSNNSASKPKRKAAVNPANVTVAVLNGTTVPGLAATLSDQIGAAGFKIGTITNFSDQQLAESVVQYAPGHQAEARAVSRRVGIGQREPVSQSSQALAGDATVIVIAGADKAP